MSMTQPPDFTDWTTSRLQFLLIEYKETLRSVKILYGRGTPDVRMYEAWIEAMEKELAKRNT